MPAAAVLTVHSDRTDRTDGRTDGWTANRLNPTPSAKAGSAAFSLHFETNKKRVLLVVHRRYMLVYVFPVLLQICTNFA